jgi:hypothetical protein
MIVSRNFVQIELSFSLIGPSILMLSIQIIYVSLYWIDSSTLSGILNLNCYIDLSSSQKSPKFP